MAQGRQQDPSGYHPGDKVRIRSGIRRGARGLIRSAMDGVLEVELSSGEILTIALTEVTNYSLAARRAWEAMPKRAGRPPKTGRRKKMVSIRIEQDIWDGLGQAVELGLISSREQAVNDWLRKRLNELHDNLRT